MKNPQHDSQPQRNERSGRPKNPNNRHHAVNRPPREQTKPAPRNHMALYVEDSPPPRREQTYNVSYETTSLSPQSIRKGFIRKVLVILMFQLAISAAAMGVTYIEGLGIREFLSTHLYLAWIALGIYIVFVLCFICKRDALAKVPQNYIILLVMTLLVSFLLAVVASVTASEITLFAGVFTAVVVLAAALYATFTKSDLSKKGFFIVGMLATALVVAIFCFTFRSRFMNFLYSGVFGIIYSFFLAYDIQRLIGKYETQYSLDEYINAAIDLYLDVVKIFLLILLTRKRSQ